jgi:hypothetical protein
MATIQAYPQQVRADATSLLVFIGPPDSAVSWSLTGNGTLTSISTFTDGQGRAYARYTPGSPGDTPTVTVDYGA